MSIMSMSSKISSGALKGLNQVEALFGLFAALKVANLAVKLYPVVFHNRKSEFHSET